MLSMMDQAQECCLVQPSSGRCINLHCSPAEHGSLKHRRALNKGSPLAHVGNINQRCDSIQCSSAFPNRSGLLRNEIVCFSGTRWSPCLVKIRVLLYVVKLLFGDAVDAREELLIFCMT